MDQATTVPNTHRNAHQTTNNPQHSARHSLSHHISDPRRRRYANHAHELFSRANTGWALEWPARPDNHRSTAAHSPLAQPPHLRPTSLSIYNARSLTASRRTRGHGLERLYGPDNQRSTAPSTPLAQPLHLRIGVDPQRPLRNRLGEAFA